MAPETVTVAETITAIPDELKRIQDEMNMHAVSGASGYAVFAIADGVPMDHTPYETYRDALKAMRWNRERYFVIEIQPDGMNAREAAAVLGYARFCHSLGGWVPAPDEADLMPAPGTIPAFSRDRRLMARQLATGRRVPDHLLRTINPAALAAHGGNR